MYEITVYVIMYIKMVVSYNIQIFGIKRCIININIRVMKGITGMLENAVKWNVSFITKILNITDEYEIDRIRYGVETLLGESIKTIIIFLLSAIIGKSLEFILVFLMMVLLRSNIGGTHAKNYYRCLLRSIVLFYALYFIADVTMDMPLIIEGVIIVFICLVLCTVKYKTRLDNSGSDQKKNIILRIKLILEVTISVLICKLFFEELMSLLLITQLYIVIDYIYMKRSVSK